VTDKLQQLSAGMPIVFGGNRVTHVSDELAAAFAPGDRLIVVQTSGDLLHVPAAVWDIASRAVERAWSAFGQLGAASDEAITAFYDAFAHRLEDDACFAPIAEANAQDVKAAAGRGRSTTRLVLSDTMRSDMIDGLRMWRDVPSPRGEVVDRIDHDGWRVEQRRAGLGVVGFVFEGRPNVFADATGVIRSGNAVVFRIGSDALGTAQAIVDHALDPAIAEAGLPAGVASLVASAERSAGHALFSDPRLALAVARGSGAAVAQLGAVAGQSGIPASLHGTGGAWIVGGDHADPAKFAAAVRHSLDRKVCNTLNTCAILRDRAEELVPQFLSALETASSVRGVSPKLHVTDAARSLIPADWFAEVEIQRADGPAREPRTEIIAGDRLGVEWEWDQSPEVTMALVDSIDDAVDLFNEQSPRFVASLVSDDEAEHGRFYDLIDAPFVGNGFTRWVDGQYALDRPELGLSNWQAGRLLGRAGVLSGDSIFTVRTRAVQTDPDLHR